jgi:hypothetical protein
MPKLKLCFFSSASSRIENASSDLRMLFQRFYECLHLELEMLPTIFENAFRRIENASHALRMLLEELKMLLML